MPLSVPSAGSAVSPGYDVVLLAGQSNMRGRGAAFDTVRYDASDPHIFQWSVAGSYANTISQAIVPIDHISLGVESATPGLGPGEHFARWWRLAHPDRRVLLVPVAFGGTPFEGVDGTGLGYNWKVGATGTTALYERAISATKAALGAGGTGSKLVAILWHQGEQDASNATSGATYQTDLDALIDGFRTRLSAPTVPFILGQMRSPADGTAPAAYAAIDTVHQATPARKPYTAFVYGPTNSSEADGLHFTAPGQRVFGRRYFDAYTAAVANTAGNVTPSPVAYGAPVDVHSTNITGSAVLLVWAPPGDATQYRVDYKKTSDSTWTTATTTAATPSYNVGGLVGSTSYDFRVAAINQAGVGAFSTTFTVSTAVAPSPILPTSGLVGRFEADALALADGANVTSWADASGAGNNLTEVNSGATHPKFKAAGINGLAIVTFDGTNSLENTVIAGTVRTKIIVGRFTVLLANGSTAVMLTTTDATNRQQLFGLGGTGYVASGTVNLSAGLGNIDTAFHAFGARFTKDATASVRVDATKVIGNTGTANSTGMRIGRSQSGTYNTLEVQAVYEWNRVLTDTEWDQVFAYISQRTGIAT